MSAEQKTVLVTGSALVPDGAIRQLETAGFLVRHVKESHLDAQELHAALKGVSGYLIGGDEEPLAEHFERATDLEAVAFVGSDFKAYVPGWPRAFELKIPMINTPGANARSVAELTISMMLALARPFDIGWSRQAPGHELYGQTLGLIGLGRIGATVARIARLGFSMSVAYHAPRRQRALEEALGVEYRSKEDLLATSTVISLHRPGLVDGESPELGEKEFALIQPESIVVNTGHIDLVDLSAVLNAMREKNLRIGLEGVGAGPVWQELTRFGSDRFVAGPQIGYYTAEANLRASLMAVESVVAVLNGRVAQNVNNPGYPSV